MDSRAEQRGPNVQADGSLEPGRRRLTRGAVIGATLGFALIAALFLWKRLDSSFSYGSVITPGNIGLLAAAALLSMGCVVGFGLLWCNILQSISAHQVRSGLRAFLYTWLGRYVPGTVPYHAARVMTAHALGTTKREVAASIAYESVLVVSSASLVGVVGILIGFGAHLDNALLYVLAGLVLATLPVGLHPRVLVPITTRLLRLMHRQPLDSGSLLNERRTTVLFVAYASLYVVNGLAFYLVTLALGEHVNPALAVGAYNLAAVLGLLALFVPSGLGVREAVLVALLSGTIATDAALLTAGLARVVALLADVATPAAQLLVDMTKRLLASRSPTQSQPERRAARGEDQVPASES